MFPSTCSGQKIFASRARCNTQLKGLAELEKRCQNEMQKVKLLSERQDTLKGMVVDKIRLQSNGKVLRTDFRGDEGAGRKDIKRCFATCADKAHLVEISE